MPKKLEIENRFLLKNLPELKYHKVLHIIQYYLRFDASGVGSRIRESKDATTKGVPCPFPFGHPTTYDINTKKNVRPGVDEENERKISKKKFEALKTDAGTVITKTRYIYKAGKLKWEIDVFQSLKLIIAEIELPKEGHKFTMPGEIATELIMDVTGIPHFTNRSLAHRIRRMG